MTTDHDTHDPGEPTADAAVDAPLPEHLPDDASATAEPSQPHDEATMRAREGLPPDTMILAPALTPPPMRCPEDAWAMLVTAVDITGDTNSHRAGEVALFAAQWVGDQPPADDQYDGDLVVRLTHPTDPTYASAHDQVADVEMLLAHQGRWRRVGQWFGLDDRWPLVVAPTAAAVMGLHCHLREAVAGFAATLPLDGEVDGEMGARVRADGTVVLTDGRVFATPSGAATAMSGYPQNGWTVLRTPDGRTLDELRAELRARRGN